MRFISVFLLFFFNDPATTEIYTYLHTLSLHDALPICRLFRRHAPRRRLPGQRPRLRSGDRSGAAALGRIQALQVLRRKSRSEEHTSELQSLMRISYAVFCLKKKSKKTTK